MPSFALLTMDTAMILVHIFVAEHKALKNLNIPINGSFN